MQLARRGSQWSLGHINRGSNFDAHGDSFTVTAPRDATLTRPYFSRPDEEQAYYDLNDPRYRNQSLAPYPLSATARVQYHGVELRLSQVVQANQRIPSMGIVPQPLLLGPAISVTLSPGASCRRSSGIC